MRRGGTKVHPEALESLRRGQAGAYFTANPYDYAGIQNDIHELWRKMCEHEGVPPESKFVIFSPDNPYRKEYGELLQKYWNLLRYRGDIKNPRHSGHRGHLGMLPSQPTTYIYIRPEDGKCVHQQAWMGHMGVEYEHDDPNWMPPKDWPYEVKDLRKKKNPGVMPWPWLPAAAQEKFITSRNPEEPRPQLAIEKFLALPDEQILKIPDEVVNALKAKGFQDEYIRTKMSIREMKGALAKPYMLQRNLWELLGPGIIGGLGWGAGYGLWRYMAHSFPPTAPLANPVPVKKAVCHRCGRKILVFPWEKTPICVDCARALKKNPFFPDLLTGLALGAGWTTAYIGIKAAAKALKKPRK